MNRLGRSQNGRFELSKSQSGTKKEPLDKALNLNGGKNASYIEPYILKLQQQLADKCSTKLIYMLNKWAARKAA